MLVIQFLKVVAVLIGEQKGSVYPFVRNIFLKYYSHEASNSTKHIM